MHFGGKIGVLVELAGGTGHEDAAREVAMHVAATDPIGVSPDDIPAAERERERNLLVEQAKDRIATRALPGIALKSQQKLERCEIRDLVQFHALGPIDVDQQE